ncbi:hypothetical protein V6N13_020269 [Hibiscus sabdariffa]
MDASSGNDDNGSNGSDASASNGPDSVHFGWTNDMVDEESYEGQEDSDESDWLDTNEEAENEANRADENVVNENEVDGADESETEGNEASSVGLSTGKETDYLGSSYVGSYETDSDGDFVSRKTTKVFFDSSTSESRFELALILVVERPTAADIPKFRRLYVCFGALKEGFKRYCRHVIGVDGCFLKGSLKGEILSIVGRDSNNQIFLIAWAYVEVENRESWAWFLNHLKDDLNLANGDNLTLLSDMQKGLLEEVSMCLPHVEHRYCARHMYANWKKDHKGGDLQLLFWNCCKATIQPLFQKHANRIGKLKPKAYAYLMVRDPSHWSKAFFSTRSKCDAIDNNFSEAFNSAIIGARFKSIISMFEDIRHYVIHRSIEHKKKSISWKGEICPRIAKKLEEHKVRSSFYHVTWNGADGYEVHNHADQPPPMPSSTGPSSPSHSIGPSAPQPSNTPSSPPHSTGPVAPPMVFMPTPSVQPSFPFNSTSPPAQPLVTKKTVFSPKRKVTANRIPVYRKSREHVTSSTTDMPLVSSQPAATVSVPKEARPSKLTIWKR